MNDTFQRSFQNKYFIVNNLQQQNIWFVHNFEVSTHFNCSTLVLFPDKFVHELKVYNVFTSENDPIWKCYITTIVFSSWFPHWHTCTSIADHILWFKLYLNHQDMGCKCGIFSAIFTSIHALVVVILPVSGVTFKLQSPSL